MLLNRGGRQSLDQPPTTSSLQYRSPQVNPNVRFGPREVYGIQPLPTFASPSDDDRNFRRSSYDTLISPPPQDDLYNRRTEYMARTTSQPSSSSSTSSAFKDFSLLKQQQQQRSQPPSSQQQQPGDDRDDLLNDKPPTSALLDDMTAAFSRRTILDEPVIKLQSSDQTPSLHAAPRSIFVTPEEESSAERHSPLSKLRRKSSTTPIVSPTHTDPFYDQPTLTQEETNESEWVTVFGFPPSQASFILNQFSQYGKIVDHKIGTGNWMHIRYDTKFLAQKALSKNGMIFDNVLMIGVVECLDPDVLKLPKKYSRLVRRPADRSRREPLAPLTKVVTGKKRAFDEIEANSNDRDLKRPKPAPVNSFFSQIVDRIFRF